MKTYFIITSIILSIILVFFIISKNKKPITQKNEIQDRRIANFQMIVINPSVTDFSRAFENCTYLTADDWHDWAQSIIINQPDFKWCEPNK